MFRSTASTLALLTVLSVPSIHAKNLDDVFNFGLCPTDMKINRIIQENADIISRAPAQDVAERVDHVLSTIERDKAKISILKAVVPLLADQETKKGLILKIADLNPHRSLSIIDEMRDFLDSDHWGEVLHIMLTDASKKIRFDDFKLKRFLKPFIPMHIPFVTEAYVRAHISSGALSQLDLNDPDLAGVDLYAVVFDWVKSLENRIPRRCDSLFRKLMEQQESIGFSDEQAVALFKEFTLKGSDDFHHLPEQIITGGFAPELQIFLSRLIFDKAFKSVSNLRKSPSLMKFVFGNNSRKVNTYIKERRIKKYLADDGIPTFSKVVFANIADDHDYDAGQSEFWETVRDELIAFVSQDHLSFERKVRTLSLIRLNNVIESHDLNSLVLENLDEVLSLNLKGHEIANLLANCGFKRTNVDEGEAHEPVPCANNGEIIPSSLSVTERENLVGVLDGIHGQRAEDFHKLRELRESLVQEIQEEDASSIVATKRYSQRIEEEFLQPMIAEEWAAVQAEMNASSLAGTFRFPKFSVVALGSLARQEMILFSDLELIFIVDINNNLNRELMAMLSQRLANRIYLLGEDTVIGADGKADRDFNRVHGPNDTRSRSFIGMHMDIAGHVPPFRRFNSRLIAEPRDAEESFLRETKLVDEKIAAIHFDGTEHEAKLNLMCELLDWKEAIQSAKHAHEKRVKSGSKGSFSMVVTPEELAKYPLLIPELDNLPSDVQEEVEIWTSLQPTRHAEDIVTLLRNTRPIFGNMNLYDQYREARRHVLDSTMFENGRSLRDRVLVDEVSDWNTKRVENPLYSGSTLASEVELNEDTITAYTSLDELQERAHVAPKESTDYLLKRYALRPLEQMLSTLGFCHDLDNLSAVDILDALVEKEVINQEQAQAFRDYYERVLTLRIRQQAADMNKAWTNLLLTEKELDEVQALFEALSGELEEIINSLESEDSYRTLYSYTSDRSSSPIELVYEERDTEALVNRILEGRSEDMYSLYVGNAMEYMLTYEAYSALAGRNSIRVTHGLKQATVLDAVTKAGRFMKRDKSRNPDSEQILGTKLLSASFHLGAGEEYESCMYFFTRNENMAALPSEVVQRSLHDEFGLSYVETKQVIKLIEAFKSESRLGGIVELLVPPHIIDDIGYLCKAYGYTDSPQEIPPLSEFLDKPFADLVPIETYDETDPFDQVRLLAESPLFASHVEVKFHYDAPEQNLVEQFRQKLSEILRTEE